MVSAFVGIDIAADSFTVAWQTADTQGQLPQPLPQTLTGFRQLARALKPIAAPADCLLVMEATSTYWMRLALFLHQHGFVVSVINPLQAKRFGQAQLQRTKTDRVDARLLSDFGRRMDTVRWSPPPPICEQLQQRLAYRDDLVQMQTQERNRLHALQRRPSPEVRVVTLIEAHLAYLKTTIATVEQEINALMLSDHSWADSAQRLLSLKGIGMVSAAQILVATQNFAYCQTSEQAVAFAGLAPRLHESGRSVRGKRPTGRGGHAALRRVLYLAAGAALQHNPPIRAFYLRLVERGKVKQVARLAAARKLLTLAWTLVVKQRTFDPNFASSALTA